MQREGFVVIVFLPRTAVGSCVFLQESFGQLCELLKGIRLRCQSHVCLQMPALEDRNSLNLVISVCSGVTEARFLKDQEGGNLWNKKMHFNGSLTQTNKLLFNALCAQPHLLLLSALKEDKTKAESCRFRSILPKFKAALSKKQSRWISVLLVAMENALVDVRLIIFPSRISLFHHLRVLLVCAVLHSSPLNAVSGKTGGRTLEQCQEKSSSA